jgi:hypothetical protein
VVQLLTKLTKKLVPFHWRPDQKRAFTELQIAFKTAPVLAHFDYEKKIVLETDASSYVSAGVLSQYDDHGILHPVAFFSKKHSPAEENYEIYDQELGAIVKGLCKSWIVAFAETVNFDNDSVSPEELWNRVKNKQTLEIFESQQAQLTDEEKIKRIQEYHDSPVAGHPGRAKTYDLLSRSHSWNQMKKDVDRYVRNCHTCQRSKATHRKTHGLLRPLQIPEQPWKDLSMDFMVGLPESEGFNAVWVVIDCLTKMQHLVPCTDQVDAKKLGEMYIKEVFRLDRLPETIVSD